MTFKIIQGDNRLVLKTLEDNSIDAIVTDPPYGIDFLGKEWDANTGALETYQECLRVLKPGGHIVAFSAARTYHHLAVTLEQAGFEIRDQIMWIYSSGFPKSQDVGRQLHKKANGKPDKQRFDPAIMIKVQGDKYSHPDTGKIYRALPDINGDRLAVAHEGQKYGTVYEEVIEVSNAWSGWGTALKPAHEPIALARKPIKQSISKNVQEWATGAINIGACRVEDGDFESRFPSNVIGEIQEEYQKYFYCPKVSRRERHIGHEMPPALFGKVKGCYDENGERFAVALDAAAKGNNHPTVKPVALMEYLIKLITPPGGTVLDPFNGSGSTGMAAVGLGYDYIGVELDPKYVDTAETRIQAWLDRDTAENNFSELFEDATE